jgi:hypothetical protein
MLACSEKREDCSNAVLPLNSIYCITAGTVVHADGLVRGNARDAFGTCGLQRPSGLAGHCAPTQRDGNNRHLCNALPGEVAHSMWTEVCVSYNCATVPARPARKCHPGCHPHLPGLGGSGLLPRHDLMPSPVDTWLLAHVVPGARSPRLATGHPTRSPPMDGLRTALRPAQPDAAPARTNGVRSLRRATR